MHAARQAVRPKHQVLVLKCYPKFQKNNVEVKANSSELSYLLYYASTRRSKLQKVADFIEKRTTRDVWKGRIGNVQVTCEILKSLIEKCPRDLPLYAGSVLRVLLTILRSNDVTLVEESVPTFEALCAHQGPVNLAADLDYIKQYEEIVGLYAQFASKEVVSQTKGPISWPVAIKFRKSGLQALRAVASSESLGTDTGRQLSIIVPVILWNIYSETGHYLETLERREAEKEEHDKDQAIRRRQSVSTVRTAETETDPVAAAITTEDADRIAEEEVGIVALQALRNIFMGVNRGQVALATNAVLRFFGNNVKIDKHFGNNGTRPCHDNSWPTTVLAKICAWAPVQDRYAILVSAMETLVRSPIVEKDMERQLILATTIDYLLSSPTSFIGLSIMDVLMGLIAHSLLVLQLGGSDNVIKPHHQQTTAVLAEKDLDPKVSGSVGDTVVAEVVNEPSRFRIQLLTTLQKCMASLAHHVYYTDQISDMISTILKRLKPSGPANTAAAIEDPAAVLDAVASSTTLPDGQPSVSNFFSFETARLTALEAVKDILVVANTPRPGGAPPSAARSPVGTRVWEGTQWLLRDPSSQVRKAYTAALVTWLNLEMKPSDLAIAKDDCKDAGEDDGAYRIHRSASSAARRDRQAKRNRNTFLALLHLAIYENAHQYMDSEPDILLLHLLLTSLVHKLGVNSIRSGLPMVLRLQDDIESIDNPVCKIRIGSLVHGYLWALSAALDFETSGLGKLVHAEISRRNDKGLWLKSIQVPPLALERIKFPSSPSGSVKLSTTAVQTEALRPFDDKQSLVDRIANGYSSSLRSPPSSPPASPSRSLSMPLLQPVAANPSAQLPSKVKDEMLSEWSKESCIASNSKDSSSESIAGSRTAASAAQKNNYLGITIPNGTLDSVNNSPLPTPRRSPSRTPSAAYGLMGRLHSPHRAHSPTGSPGSSSVQSTVRVDDLKRVLSGSAPRTSYSTARPMSHRRERSRDVESSGSDSMVSADFSISETSFMASDQPVSTTPGEASTPAATLTPRPPTAQSSASHQVTHAAREREAAFKGDAVPPVPPIPASLRDSSSSPTDSRPKTAPSPNATANPLPAATNGNGSLAVRKSRSVKRASSKSRPRERTRSGSRGTMGSENAGGRMPHRVKKKPDFSGFLEGIDDGETDHGLVAGVRPPY